MNLLQRSVAVIIVLLLWAEASFPQMRARPASLYYTGSAEAADLETARLRAYQNLVQQIQVFVSSTLRRTLSERNASVTDSSSASTVAMSLVTLRDVEEESLRLDDGSYRVQKSVSRESVGKFFAARRARIMERIRAASGIFRNSDLPYDISAALKDLYAASLELALYPEAIDSSFTVFDARAFGISRAGIASAIDAIAAAIRFEPLRRIDDDYIVWKYRVQMNGHPVSALRMEFYDGIGQTDADIRQGEALLTFYFGKHDEAERTVRAYLEFRFEEELDASLRIADSLCGSPSSHPFVTLTVPASQSSSHEPNVMLASTEKGAAAANDDPIPEALRALIGVRRDFDALIRMIDEMQKRHVIAAGSAHSFESLDGLYAVVVAKDRDAVFLHRRKETLINIETGAEAQLAEFAGGRIIWIEVLDRPRR